MERIKRILLITIFLILLMFLQTTISNAAEISSRLFEINEEEKTISKIPMNATVEEVKAYIASEEEIKIFSKEGYEVGNSHEIRTGMILKAGEEEYSLVITGDTSGDGKRTVVDIAQVKMHLVDIKLLEGIYLKAADINYDNVVNVVDLSRLKLIVLGLLDIDSKLEVPIPEGYVASEVEGENKIEDGLVIYEGTEAVTEENHETALITRNQYVWIPVGDINDMVMCSSNTVYSVCNLVYDEVADTLTCQTHPKTATNLVGRLYSGTSASTTDDDGNIIQSYTMDFTKRDQIYNTSSGYHEPAVVAGPDGTSYDGNSSNLEIAGMPAGSTAQQFLTQLQSDFTVMAKSVAKNGGFYISRYEVGANGDSKKNQQVLTAAISNGTNYLGANKWYGLYNTLRENNRPMIWGCQYDQVIKFLKENGEDPENGHSDRNLTIDHALSGQNELDKMKNIYDLEGNHAEWTAEADSTDTRAYRGSNYSYAYDGYFCPASYRYSNYPTFSSVVKSSRSTLYL